MPSDLETILLFISFSSWIRNVTWYQTEVHLLNNISFCFTVNVWAWGMRGKDLASIVLQQTQEDTSPGGQCNTEQASQRASRAAILVSLKTWDRQTHEWPSLILVMTAVKQAGGQTGGPSESPSHKILDTAFLGHKGTCNYTALKLQGK